MHYLSFLDFLVTYTKNRQFETISKFLSLIYLDIDYVVKTEFYKYDTKNNELTFILGSSREHFTVQLSNNCVIYHSHIFDSTCDEFEKLNNLVEQVKEQEILIHG